MTDIDRKMEDLQKTRKDFSFDSREVREKTAYRLGYERPVVVRCFDSRLNVIFAAFFEENGWSHKDVISLPGGARALASSEPADAAAKQAILDAIGTAIRAHEAKWILLTIHFDCQGYGTRFPSDEAERERQRRDLEEAVRTVAGNLTPEFFVEGRYVDATGIHPVCASRGGAKR